MAAEAPAGFTSPEEMSKFLTDAREAIVNTKTNGERISVVETLAKQLSAGLDEVNRKRAEAGSRLDPTGTNTEVVRSYYTESASADDFAPDVVVDLRARGAKVDENLGHSHVASGGGVVRLFGERDESGYFQYGLLDDPAPKSAWQVELQERAEALAIVKAAKGPRANVRRLMRGLNKHLARGPEQIAKVFADNAGEGGEWIVSLPLPMLEKTIALRRQLEDAIPEMAVSGSSSFTYPFATTGVQAFLHNVPAAGDMNPSELPKSVPVTAERSISLKTLVINVPIDMDAAEDSIVDSIAQLRMMIAEAEVDATEDALINGDTATTHGDTSFSSWNPRNRWQTLGSSVDHRRGWIGLRHRAFDVSNAADKSAAQGPANMLAFLATLNVPHGLDDCVYVTSPEHYLAKILIDSSVLTVDKYGSFATLLRGEVARIGGRPLILSEFMTADLASTGLYTASGATTGYLAFNRSRFRMVRRRSFRLNLTNEYTRHTTWLTASSRKTFHTFDSSSTKNVGYAYNMSAS